MLNYYENHKWMCPICKVRFLLNKKDKSEYNENKNENFDNENKENNNNNNNNNNNIYLNEEEIFNSISLNKKQRKIKNFPIIYTSFGQMKKELSQINFNELKKLGFDEIFPSGIITKNRGYSSNNIPKNKKINHSYREREKILKNRNLSEIKDLYNINDKRQIKTKNNEKEEEYENEKENIKRLSNININLNVNVNINNNSNIKIPYPYKINSNSTKNISKFTYYNQIKLLRNNIEDKKFTSDDYNIISQIGEGTFGKIYQVENNINKKKYAMKKILANSIEDNIKC